MSNSTITRLEAFNRVLLNVSEKEITTSVGLLQPTNTKAKHAIIAAHNDVVTCYDWSWLQRRAVASSWNTQGVATITDMQRLRNVIWDGGFAVPSVPYRRMNNAPETPFVWPQAYALIDDNKVQIWPWPLLTIDQNKFEFNYIASPPVPSTDAGVFQMPDRYVELLILKATYYMFMRHVHDREMAAYTNGEYELLQNNLMNRERSTPTSTSLFQGNAGHQAYGRV